MQRFGLCALLAVLSFGEAGCGGEGEKSTPPPATTGYVDPGVPPAAGVPDTKAAPAPAK